MRIGSQGTSRGRSSRAKGSGKTRGSKHDARHVQDQKGAGRADGSLYAEVTRRIITELDAGRIPWVQPWDNVGIAPGLPRNVLTRRGYSGINVLLLWGAVIERGYPTQNWLTFSQALEAGGAVRKGEKGTQIVFADRFTPMGERERATADGAEPKQVAFLKRFTVFNVAQCDNLPDRMTMDVPPLPERELVPLAEDLIQATGADFRIGGNRAFYAPGDDYVAVPPQAAFKYQIDYYRTALHELGHWTGHASRLGRDFSGRFGTPGYAREELCAELASAYLCASLSIQPTVRHADYIGSWLEVLRSDDRAIFRAASLASKAADFLLGFMAKEDGAQSVS